MRFFSQFPKTDYRLSSELTKTSLIDIYRHVDVNNNNLDDVTNYTFYTIKDGERPDIVSFKLYNSPEYHWTFFIINDGLKEGLNGWPRSYQEQILYINEKYDEYSVLEFIPSQEEVTDGIKYNNYFDGLDLSDPKIQLRELNNDHTADLVSYDSNRLQAWVKNLSSSSFLSNEEATYVLDYNGDSVEDRNNWLSTSILPFVKDYHPTLYSTLIADDRIVTDNIIPYIRGIASDHEYDTLVYNVSDIILDTNVDGNGGIPSSDFNRGSIDDFLSNSVESLLYDVYLEQIQFTTSRSWLKSYNAPSYYTSIDGAEVTTYDALKSDPNNDNYTSFATEENSINESKSQIRVLRYADVESFSDYYNELVNE